jgi:hypothetical protein
MATIPYNKAFVLGKGYNSLNGSALGSIFKSAPQYEQTPGARGQEVQFTLQIIKSLEHLYESLGIDVEVDANVGPFFSMEGKFSYASQSSFNSQSVFFLVRVTVRNAPLHIKQNAVEFNPDVLQILKDGDAERFRRGFGDSYIEGMITGGEYFALYEMVCTDAKTQSEVKAELEVSAGTFAAGMDLKTKFNKTMEQVSKKSTLKVSVFSMGGVGLSVAKDIDTITQQAQNFPNIVQGEAAVPYEVITASYETLPLPHGPNYVALESQRYELMKYAKDILKLRAKQNDLEYICMNPEEFCTNANEDLKNEDLEKLQNKLIQTTNYIAAYTRHAIQCATSAAVAAPFTSSGNPLPAFENMPQRKNELDYVVIYDEKDFKGNANYLSIEPKGYPTSDVFELKDNSICSIKIPKTFKVHLYDAPYFDGVHLPLIKSYADLEELNGFNKKTSSIFICKSNDPDCTGKPDATTSNLVLEDDTMRFSRFKRMAVKKMAPGMQQTVSARMTSIKLKK